jgi:short-subunit dehydrogenase involved in D-alanine esterification of teichoic acids
MGGRSGAGMEFRKKKRGNRVVGIGRRMERVLGTLSLQSPV